MKFEFKINKYYLVGYAMMSKNKPFPDWQKLEEKIWQKYRDEPAYYFLNPKYISWALEKLQTDFTEKNIESVFTEQAKTLKKIYQEIFKSKEFKRLYKETYKHLLFIKKQWQKNEKEALKILREISKLPIPKQKITVYITHPKSYNGKTIDQNTIVCGHIEKWKNHITICLCHELLHIMTWPGHFQSHYDILHSIILLNDNELKIRLNKKGIYFKEGKLNIEPPEFFDLEKKILPYWKKYLNGGLGKNILEFKNSIKAKIKQK
ncbi:MAG: hypothetical protein AAB616_00465 [Patescibacteria group bacterium]